MTQIRWTNFVLTVLTIGGTALEEAITAHSVPPEVAVWAWLVHILMAMLVASAAWLNANTTTGGKVAMLGKPKGA